MSPSISCSFTQHSIMTTVVNSLFVSTADCVMEQWNEYFVMMEQ